MHRPCGQSLTRVSNQLVVVAVAVDLLQCCLRVLATCDCVSLTEHYLSIHQLKAWSMSAMEETPSRDNVLLRRPAITTVVLLAALLVPVVAIPYTLTRRRVSCLTQQIDHLIAANADLQKLVSKSAHDIALRREEFARAISLLERSKGEISLLRRDISQTQVQLNSFQSATRTELQTLLDEGKLTRQALPTSASQCATCIRHSCLHPSDIVLIYFLGLVYR